MTEFNQFGSAKPQSAGNPQHCAQFEAMLTDALDGALSPAEQAIFDRHQTGCVVCSQMLAEAQRGFALLEMLRSPRPEPAGDLIDRIFAHTSGIPVAAAHASKDAAGQSAYLPIAANGPRLVASIYGSAALPGTGTSDGPIPAARILPFRSRVANNLRLRNFGHILLQPRLAMTAAMAFFSVALTLNLTGVRITDLRAADLRPSAIKRNLYQTNARVVSYYYNLRVVYELESRVRDLQRATDADTPAPKPDATRDLQPSTADPRTPAGAAPASPQQKQARPKSGSGTSRREAITPNRIIVGSARPFPHAAPPSSLVAYTPQIRHTIQEGGLV